MGIKTIFDMYEESKNKIFEYFGYVEDWKVIPLDFDTINFRWYLEQDENGSGFVYFFDENDDVYMYKIYTQRFLNKWVYRGEDYTMICSDTQVDDNKLLSVFDNKLKLSRDQLSVKMLDDMY